MRLFAYGGFSLSKQNIMSVKEYQEQNLHQTRTLILKYFSCNLHEGPIISLQGVGGGGVNRTLPHFKNDFSN